MQEREIEKRTNRNIDVITVSTLLLGIMFFRGIPEGSWPVILVLAVLQLYLHGVSVRISERTDISLGTSAVLPMMFFTGITASMMISVVLGVYDGVRNKKQWRRTMFNAAQFALSTLVATLSLEYVLAAVGESSLGFALALTGATVVYIVSNIGLVCRMVAIWRGVSWFTQMKAMLKLGFFSSLSSGFIGIVFTYFVLGYGFWGLVVFSILLVNLSGLLKAAAEVSAERVRRQEVEEELVIDEMTGAYNFRYLNTWLSSPSDGDLSLLFIDVDDFSVFNDTYGHAEGDRVLGLLVETINSCVRADDQVIRYGGDEFVVFLRNMNAEDAERVAERIMKGLSILNNSAWEEALTVSLGIAAKPEHTADKRELLLFADQAMYKAKGLGKSQIQMWNAVKDPA
ncbi:MAG TPA: diguanylate cyclase [Limnochordia bacterium]|nr:diguanylate cyclase [Limnochordia bacterium]